MKLEGIEQNSIQTDRLNVSYLSSGDPKNPPLILIHGNVSSNLFWDETIRSLANNYWVIAPDMRGYGETEALPIDATRGLRDWSDDLKSFVTALNIKQPLHLLGWSLGGGIVMQYAIDHSTDLASMILINPVSPFGFGGTKDKYGTPNHENYAGSGGGTANPQFVELLKNGYRSEDNPNSPLNVMNQFYFKPPFRVAKDREEIFIDSMLSTRIGDGFYPGSFSTAGEWPGVVPGEDGINNAMSPKFMNLSPISEIKEKVPILWIRGANDIIVSDQSFFDFGFLGSLGYVEGWPGDEIYPPQPMVSQTRYVLDEYQNKGGSYEEIIVDDAGHSPHIEKPEIVFARIKDFIK